MSTKADLAATKMIGEPTIEGIWFQTKPLPWFKSYTGGGTILEFFLLAAFFVFDYFLPKKTTETEALLKYAGHLYCARTNDELVFIACQKDTQQMTGVFQHLR